MTEYVTTMLLFPSDGDALDAQPARARAAAARKASTPARDRDERLTVEPPRPA
jgi:hypothetical protein